MYQSINKENRITIITLIMVAMFAVIGIFSLQSLGKNEGYRTIRIVEVSGNASVVRDRMEYRAYEGMLLSEGDELVTVGNSTVRLVLDGSKYIKLEAGSKLVFEKLGMLGSNRTSLRLERGALTSEIVKPLGIGEEFIVNTPNVVLAVRGTFFRVEIENDSNDEVKSNVITYGGTVASKRITETGEIEETEVLVNSGYKTTINQKADGTGGEVKAISIEDINDDDLVDIYFAAENGHELFITAQEVKEKIEEREINLEDKVSVYEKAKENQDKIIDDNIPIIKNEATQNNNISGVIIDGDINNEKDDEIEKPTGSDESETDESETGESETGEIESVHKHDFADWNLITEPDCNNEGYMERVCAVCGEIESYIAPKLEHKFTDLLEEADYYERWCTVCGYDEKIYKAEDGHVCEWGEWRVEREATCQATGSKIRECKVCHKWENKTIWTISHTLDPDTKEILKTPACERIGLASGYCTMCDMEVEVEVDPLGHDFADEFIVVRPTCDSNGYKMRCCNNCEGYTDYTEIPSEGHNYELVVLVDPESASVGRQYYECSKCADTKDGEDVIPLNQYFFPDANFRQFLETNFNVDGYDGLSQTELDAVIRIDLSGPEGRGCGVRDVTGIHYFKNIEYLSLAYNDVRNVELLGLEKLETLDVSMITKMQTVNLVGTDNIHTFIAVETAYDTGTCIVHSSNPDSVTVATIKAVDATLFDIFYQ